MSLQNMKNQGSYTLAKLKDEVYKALGEYSRNGMELGELSFQRADLSHKMISALNSAISRASVSLPTFVESFMPRFLSCECLYRNNKPFELKSNQTTVCETKLSEEGLSFWLLASGEGTIKLFDESEEVVFEKHISASDIKFENVSFFAENLPKDKKTLSVCADLGAAFVVRELVVYKRDDFLGDKHLISPYGYVSAALPEDFGSLEGVEKDGMALSKAYYSVCEKVIMTEADKADGVTVYYTPKNLVIDENTPEDSIINLPDITCLGVIYLAASELCDTGDGELYSRLLYKYRELALNCYDRKYAPKIKNSFYDSATERLRRKCNVIR